MDIINVKVEISRWSKGDTKLKWRDIKSAWDYVGMMRDHVEIMRYCLDNDVKLRYQVETLSINNEILNLNNEKYLKKVAKMRSQL